MRNRTNIVHQDVSGDALEVEKDSIEHDEDYNMEFGPFGIGHIYQDQRNRNLNHDACQARVKL